MPAFQEDRIVRCATCEQDFGRYDIHQCPICHKQCCSKCSTNKGGKHFCSQYCAEFFFFVGDDDEG